MGMLLHRTLMERDKKRKEQEQEQLAENTNLEQGVKKETKPKKSR